MDATSVTIIIRDLLITGLMLSAPAVAVSLLIGLIVAILQTLTSIQEQTLTFAPRIFAVGVTLAFCLPWTIRVMSGFMMRMMTLFAEAGR